MRILSDWKFWGGLVLSGLFLFFAFKKVDISALAQVLKTVQYIYLIPVLILTVFSLWVRALRWRFLLRPIKSISMKSMFSATSIGFMANNIFPARLGEIIRAYVIDRREHVGKSASFATIVVERVFDGMTVLFFLFIVLLFLRFEIPGWIRSIMFGALFIYLFALFVLIVLKIRTEKTLKVIQWIISALPERLNHRIEGIFHSFVRGLDILHDTRNIIISVVLSLLVWFPHALLIYIQLVAFDIHLSFFAAMFIMVIICFGVMIPSAPGYVGTIQFLSVAGLALFQVPREDALSFSLLYHATQYIPVTGIGLAYFFLEGFSFSQIRKNTQAFDENNTADESR